MHTYLPERDPRESYYLDSSVTQLVSHPDLLSTYSRHWQ